MSTRILKPLLVAVLGVAMAIAAAPYSSAAGAPPTTAKPSNDSSSDSAKPAGKPNTQRQSTARSLAVTEAADAAVNSAEIADSGCTTNSLAANDDGSTGVVDLPFPVDFYGTQYASLYVNNNGNVTFGSPLSTFTPFTITADTPPIIAAFLADVDTRGAGSSLVTYGETTLDGRQAFCVNWNGVGYYASHTDKLNSFQLVLVERGDTGSGDFDIVMNYGQLLWETGDASGGSNGFGGSSAGAGFSAGDGNADHYFQFPGTLSNGALLDTNPDGLVHGSRGSLEAGRYVFPIRNGVAPGSSTLTGTVKTATGDAAPTAAVQACPASGSGTCLVAYTSSAGVYTLVGLPAGDWNLTAYPPAGSNGLAAHAGPVTVATGSTITTNLALGGPTPPPTGTTITGTSGDHGTSGGLPVIYWGDDLTLTTQGCTGGTTSATYQITQGETTVRSGALTETPDGSNTFQATVGAFYPVHGDAHVSITLNCSAGTTSAVDFDIYIDPSGTVVDTVGNPIAGATVTLLRSDTEDGTFAPVPDGDAVMSPSNRHNPDTTATDGTFHWDVLAGWYKITASKAGCTVPGSSDTVASSAAYDVPPPALNVTLTLDCGEDAGSSHTTLTVSPDSPVVGQPVTMVATVGGSDPAPTGTVTFKRGMEVRCDAVPLVDGSATCSTTFTSAGALTAIAEYSGDSHHPSSSDRKDITIGKATPVVTWASTGEITYPAPLSDSILNATADVPGTFEYSVGEQGADGLVLDPRDTPYQISLTFRPTNQADYRNVNASLYVTVLKGAQVITADPVSDVVFGSAATTTVTFHGGPSGNAVQVSTSSPACSVGTISAGSNATFSATINVLQVGTCTLTANQAGNANYSDAEPVSASFAITPAASGQLKVDATVAKDQRSGAGKIVSPALTTTGPNELVVALVSADGPASNTAQKATVSGGGLIWSLVSRSNTTWGTAEIWQAYATAKLSGATITASLRKSGYDGSLTVTAFSGAKNRVGASAAAGGTKNGVSVRLTPGANGSMVWAVGHDWTGAQSVVPGSGQALGRQFVDTRVGDTYWTQKLSATSTAGSVVTMSAALPRTHRWQLTAVEIPAG